MEKVIKSPLFADDVVKLWQDSSEALVIEKQSVTIPDVAEDGADVLEVLMNEENEVVKDIPTSFDNVYTSTDDSASARIEDDDVIFERFWDMHRETLLSLEQKAASDGYAKGESEAQSKYVEAIERFNGLADAGQAAIANVLRDAEALIGAIVFESVSKIVGGVLADADGCKHVVSQVIKDTLKSDIVVIKVSPKDFERIRAATSNNDASLESRTSIDGLPVEADAAVELGGCLVELRQGRIDGRIETQFRLFAQSIKESIVHR